MLSIDNKKRHKLSVYEITRQIGEIKIPGGSLIDYEAFDSTIDQQLILRVEYLNESNYVIEKEGDIFKMVQKHEVKNVTRLIDLKFDETMYLTNGKEFKVNCLVLEATSTQLSNIVQEDS